MKYFLFLAFILLTVDQCSDISEEQELMSVTYQATSRGYYYEVHIADGEIAVKYDSNDTPSSRPLKNKEIRKVISLVTGTNYEVMETFVAPSEKRFFDGAAHALLKVNDGMHEYISSDFDHGNPPEQLEPLVKAILTLAETVEKE